MRDFDPHFRTKNEMIAASLTNMATRIRDLRRNKGMSLIDLASQSEVNKDTIVAAESTAALGMQLQTFFSIAWGLEVQPAELLGWIQSRPNITTLEHELILAHRKLGGFRNE